jgi:immunity protein Imm1 of predicted polymorphic toxin system
MTNRTYTAADLAEAEAAIRQLDGTACSEVVLKDASGRRLTVAAGPEQFVVEMADNAGGRWRVVDPTKGQEPIRLVVAGISGNYPAYRCVGLDAALEATRAFLSGEGERSARLMWSMIG